MAIGTVTRTPWWAWAWPLLAWIVLALQLLLHGNVLITALEALALIATVFAACITRKWWRTR